jgi:D-3-phosphoglycerate dehydrogenase / 2-oxoglutarate reductase
MSKKRRVIFIDNTHPFLFQRLSDLGFDCEAHYQTSREALLPQLSDCFGLVLRSRLRIDAELINSAENLAFIARSGVGLEHIDVELAEKRGIKVIPSPEGSRDTVAEHAIGMLLMLMNNLGLADRQIRDGQWVRAANRGIEIKGKTIGIIGYGNMGSAFAQKIRGFGARLIAYDKFKTNYADELVEEVALEQIWAEADIVTLHIPYLPENYHFVDHTFLQHFQKNIFLINTARGTVLNTSDLVQNLQSGKVLGAALDVFEYEEQSFENLKPTELPEPFQYLRKADNVVLTPHLGGSSVESNEGHARVLAQKIEHLFC